MRIEIGSVLRNILPAIIFLAFIVLIVFALIVGFCNRHSTNKNPLKTLKFMLIVLFVLILAIPVINIFEKEKIPEWYIAMPFLVAFLSVFYEIFKQQQKRIEALEEKLNNRSLRDDGQIIEEKTINEINFSNDIPPTDGFCKADN